MSLEEDDMEDITIKFRLTGEVRPSLDVRDDMGIGPPQRKRLQSGSSLGSEEGMSDEDITDDDRHDNVNKPLMYPRKRPRLPVHAIRRSPYKRCLWTIVYLFIIVATLLAAVFLVIYFVNSYTNRLLLEEFKEQWTDSLQALPCSEFKVEDVWVKGFPKLLTESAFRLLDINHDGVLDVIMGFATGGDKLRADFVVCDIYFNGSKPCGGGLLALDGSTGSELWRRYSLHEIFSLNCNADLDGDGLHDCIGGGRAGTFVAVSSSDGHVLWTFNDTSLNDVMNLYTGQFIQDLDGDGVQDVLNIHGGDPLGEPGSNTRLPGKLMFFSGKMGKVLKWSYVPDMRESYYSPVLYNNTRGLQVLFGTGGETHPGSLWRIKLDELWKGHIDKAQRIFTDQFKGIMTPPVLIDLTLDGVEDIVFSTYNSTVLAVDGDTYRQLWNYSFPSTETYATPAPGFYNNDSVPDFLVRWQYGPGFPIYYHSIMTILDGKTGQPLVEPFPRDSVGAQSSPLTVSMETQGSNWGHDLFLYWMADCMFHEGEGGEYLFKQGTNVHEQSRSDFCKLRFKSDGYSQLLAYSHDLQLPGSPLYTSWKREKVEHAAWVNTTQESLDFLAQHPEHMERFLQIQAMIEDQKDSWRKSNTKQVTASEDTERLLGYRVPPSADYTNHIHPSVGRKAGHQFELEAGYKPDLLRDRSDNDFLQDDPSNNLLQDYNHHGYSLTDARYKKPSNRYSDIYKQDYSQNTRDDYGRFHHKYEYKPKPYTNDYSRDFPYNQLSSLMANVLDERPVSRYPSSPYPESLGNPYDRIQHAAAQGRKRNRPHSNLPTNNYKYRQLPYRNLKRDTAKIQSLRSEITGKYNNLAPQKDTPHRSENLFKKRKSFKTVTRKKRERQRKKRHLGPHDEGGLQRLISTGTLAPTLLPSTHTDFHHSIDVIFATYWFFPAKTSVLLPEDEGCIAAMMETETQRFDPNSKYYGMDHDGYQHAVQDECMKKSGHEMPEGGTYETQATSTAYNLHMGQMTVYRLRLICKCGEEKELIRDRKRCLKVLPFSEQQWGGYMGSSADSHWLPRKHSKHS